jgi:hypothetical protein
MDVRHVVKIEVFPAIEDCPPCDCDGADGLAEDGDHLEEMQDLLEQLDEGGDVPPVDESTRSMRFDLCDACRQRFVKNPLGAKTGKQLDFSNN